MVRAILFALSVAMGLGIYGSAVANEAGGPVMGVSDLPDAGDRRFATLDEYLAFLEARGPFGVAFYQRLPDGRYELVRRRGGAAPEVFTRAELAARYGFTE